MTKDERLHWIGGFLKALPAYRMKRAARECRVLEIDLVQGTAGAIVPTLKYEELNTLLPPAMVAGIKKRTRGWGVDIHEVYRLCSRAWRRRPRPQRRARRLASPRGAPRAPPPPNSWH